MRLFCGREFPTYCLNLESIPAIEIKGIMVILVLIFGYLCTNRITNAATNYRVMEIKESWEDAWFSCSDISGSLVPDLGTINITNQLLPLIPANEMLWLFAKQITMEYPFGNQSIYRYVQLSYRSADTFLDHFLCSSGETLPSGKYVWDSVSAFCERMTGSLMTLSSIKQLRYLMPFLKDDMEFWINKYEGYMLPSLASPLDTEQCVGIIKHSPTKFSYVTTNCTTELRYICDISPNSMNTFAPTLKRRSSKFPVYIPDMVTESSNLSAEIDNGYINKSRETTNIGLIVGPIVGGLVVVLVVVVVVVYKKKKRRQEKYRKRRERYFSGRSKRTAGSLQNGDIQHIDRDGTLDCLTSDKHSVIVGMDKGRYVHLREDATMTTIVSEGEGQYEGQVDKKSINIDQPGYYLMDMKSSRPSYINKKAAIQVPMCYEPFEPDPVQLKEQIKSIKNRNAGNVKVKLPSDTKKSTEIKKTPLRPVRVEPVKQDSNDYKEPRASKPPELPVKKFKGARYLENRQGGNKETKPSSNSSIQPVPVRVENQVNQEPELYASKNLGDPDQSSHDKSKPNQNNRPNNADQVSSLNDLATYETCDQNMMSNDNRSPLRLDDLGPYENSNTPPIQQIIGNQRSPVMANTQGFNQQALNELDAYENFDMPQAGDTGVKTGQTQNPDITRLDELDQYESFETHQVKKNDDVLWKDIDNYENLPLYQ